MALLSSLEFSLPSSFFEFFFVLLVITQWNEIKPIDPISCLSSFLTERLELGKIPELGGVSCRNDPLQFIKTLYISRGLEMQASSKLG
jgi:hypothetical protein